jgi:nitroreductase
MTTPETALQQLLWRYATKKFDPTKTIPDHLWQVLEQSLVLAPSSFGLQPWKFIVVRNSQLRHQLLEHSWGQTQVKDASHLVVFAIKKDLNAADVDRYVKRMADVQQTTPDSLEGFSKTVKGFIDTPPYPMDLNEWSKRQVYIALGQYMTTAAMLGIDTCPMEGFVPTKYDEILGLEAQGYATAVLCPAGYRAEDDKSAARPKVRFETRDVVQYLD